MAVGRLYEHLGTVKGRRTGELMWETIGTRLGDLSLEEFQADARTCEDFLRITHGFPLVLEDCRCLSDFYRP